jgi:hypothetical protein
MRRISLLGAVAVAALGLSSCVGIGAVNQGSVTRRAQERGGGVTTDLVADALAAVAAETGDPTLRVHTLTAELAAVTVVVAGDQPGRLTSWRYGTSGLYGGRGLAGPDPVRAGGGEAVSAALFGPDEAGLDELDAMVERVIESSGVVGGWVETATVARPGPGAAPTVTFVVTDDLREATVVVGGDG